MHFPRRYIFAALILTAIPNTLFAQANGDSLFTFRSSFWINLHQFLYAQAQARSGFGRRQTILSSLGDTVGYGRRSEAEKKSWELAIAHYAIAVAPKDFLFDSASIEINNRLANTPDEASLAGVGLDPALAEVLTKAAPLYRSLWWPRHDGDNRRWVTELRGRLDMYGDAVQRRVTHAFRTSWPVSPIVVDVCAYAGWAGAYTTEHPSHIFISSRAETNLGDAGIESIFHEALHTMDSAAVVESANGAAKIHVPPPPYDVVHALIFFTAADAASREIAGYRSPYLSTVWERKPFVSFRPIIVEDWQPYLNGKSTFEASFEKLVADLQPLLVKAAR